MSNIILYAPSDLAVPNRVTEYLTSVNTPDYDSIEYKVVNPDLSSVNGVLQKYWKVSEGSVVEMSTEEKESYDSAYPAPLPTKDITEILETIYSAFTSSEQAFRITRAFRKYSDFPWYVLTQGYGIAKTIIDEAYSEGDILLIDRNLIVTKLPGFENDILEG